MDDLIERLIKPPVRRCTGADDPLGLNGEPAWHLTDLLIPRHQAHRDRYLSEALRPNDQNT